MNGTLHKECDGIDETEGEREKGYFELQGEVEILAPVTTRGKCHFVNKDVIHAHEANCFCFNSGKKR